MNPILALLLKDHKEVKEGCDPKTRPVCGASRSINGEISEWVSVILDAVNSASDPVENISTEELLSHVDDLVLRLNQDGMPSEGICVGSLDVKDLYPSLNIVESAKICGAAVKNSELEFEDVDWTWATLYIALNMQQNQINQEKLQDLVPRRVAKRGRRPTVLSAKDDEKKDRWEWKKPPKFMLSSEKKVILGKVMEIMITTTFGHHYYKWGADVLRQVTGGAIGLRATGSVARRVMAHFLAEYKKVLEDNGIRVYLLRKYVDDILSVTNKLELGSRWRATGIIRNPEDIEEDIEQGISKEDVTMEVLRAMADTVVPWLEFTSEVSEGREKPVLCLDS